MLEKHQDRKRGVQKENKIKEVDERMSK